MNIAVNVGSQLDTQGVEKAVYTPRMTLDHSVGSASPKRATAMTLDRDKLREVAKRACRAEAEYDSETDDKRSAQFDLMAATQAMHDELNPPTVLALLDEVDRLRSLVETLQTEIRGGGMAR